MIFSKAKLIEVPVVIITLVALGYWGANWFFNHALLYNEPYRSMVGPGFVFALVIILYYKEMVNWLVHSFLDEMNRHKGKWRP